MRPLLLAVLAIGCGPSFPAPLPRVLATSPTGVVAPDAVAVEIAFSGPVDRAGLEDGRWFALARREDLRDVLRAAESEQGLGAGAPVVASRVELVDGGTRVVLRPAAPLDPERGWAAVLSYRVRSADGRAVVDADGKARTVAVLFETGPAADRTPPRPRWIRPPHGPVPANLRAIRVAFDEPVSGALAAAGAEGRSGAIAPDLLELELGAPLAPGLLALDLDGVHDAAGNASAPLDPIAISRCTADAAPRVEPVIRVTPGRLSIAIDASLRGMGRLVASVSARPGDPACGDAPPAPGVLVARGEVRPCPGWDPCAPEAIACPATLTVEGLCPGQELALRLDAEDLAGHVGGGGPVIGAASLPPRAEPVITEVLADADPPEDGGEYVEVANLGTGELDLAGYALAKRTASGKLVRCVIGSAPAPVRAGGHALVAGGAYDGRYAVPEGTAAYRCGPTALDGGLANDQPVAVALLDPAGATVSSAGMLEAVERCAAGALERIHPAAPDAASNWACPGTRSPGSCNGVTPASECPRRPW